MSQFKFVDKCISCVKCITRHSSKVEWTQSLSIHISVENEVAAKFGGKIAIPFSENKETKINKSFSNRINKLNLPNSSNCLCNKTLDLNLNSIRFNSREKFKIKSRDCPEMFDSKSKKWSPAKVWAHLYADPIFGISSAKLSTLR